MTEHPAVVHTGWDRPILAKKWHWFNEGETLSLCGTWILADTGVRSDMNHDSPDNCAKCKRLLGRNDQ